MSQPKPQSPLEAYAQEIQALVRDGHGASAIADQLRLSGVATTEGSIRRFFKRHNIEPKDHKGRDHISQKTPSVAWGFGRPELTRPVHDDELVVALFDQHFPYHEPGLIEAVISLVADIQPDRVILGGDGVDLFLLSRFYDGTSRINSLQDDIDQYAGFVKRLRQAAPNAKMDVVDSNHESRLVSFLEKSAPQLKSLRALDPQLLLGYRENHVEWHPGCGFLLRGGLNPFLVKHGSRVSSTPGGTARQEAMSELCNGISGHVHRAENWTRRGATSTLTWTVSGTMSRLDADYINGAVNWSHGILVLEITKVGNNVIHQIPFTHGKLRIGLKAY